MTSTSNGNVPGQREGDDVETLHGPWIEIPRVDALHKALLARG
ncbi:hypothetical protein ACFXGA_26955 [Actinosynnema sp. NPDC059335]